MVVFNVVFVHLKRVRCGLSSEPCQPSGGELLENPHPGLRNGHSKTSDICSRQLPINATRGRECHIFFGGSSPHRLLCCQKLLVSRLSTYKTYFVGLLAKLDIRVKTPPEHFRLGRKRIKPEEDAAVFDCPVRCGAETLHPCICTPSRVWLFLGNVAREKRKTINKNVVYVSTNIAEGDYMKTEGGL